MNAPLPFVSICLLTYKRAAALPKTLESLLQQTHQDFELIINDDNSPDETESVGRAYERRDSRVRYFKNHVNLRYAGNQNAALERARSEYVAIVHDGDIYRDDLIEKWTRALVTYQSAALVFNALEAMDLHGQTVAVNRHPFAPLISGRDLLRNMLQRPDSPIFGIVMVRKPCIHSAGRFDTSLPTLADVDMWMRLMRRFDAAYIDEPLIKVAAREVGHHNRMGNWAVRAEHEKIYQLNLARIGPDADLSTPQLRRNVWRMLWMQRIHWLLGCAKRLKLASFSQGVGFCLKHPYVLTAGGQGGINS
jgi:glycosyltransferase involved in cell wall biosynthesis